jgi:hypothetical protein
MATKKVIADDVKPARKIAIVGTAPSSLHLAPWNKEGWEIWGCAGVFSAIDVTTIKNLALWFEIHTIEQIMKDFNTLEVFKKMPCPVIMIDENPDLPNSKAYPLDKILAFLPRYFSNTISYMIAYAIWLHKLGENIETIGVWGVDMAAGGEYAFQRPSCEFYLGVAQGMGIEVIIPGEADLMKCSYLYGFEEEKLGADMAKYQAREKELGERLNLLEGQLTQKLLQGDDMIVTCPGCQNSITVKPGLRMDNYMILMQKAHLQGCIENGKYLINQRIGVAQ